MKRKVIKQGPSSFMISLPKSWVRQKEINKGQELEVEVMGDNILVSIESSNSNSNIKDFILNEFNIEDIFRYYSEGFSGMNISFKSEKDFEEIKKIIDSLIGADILDREKYVVNILFSDLKLNIDEKKLIIKNLSILKWQVQSLLQELKTKKMRNYEEIFEINLDLLSKINLLLRSIYCKKRIGSDFVNYKASLDCLKNIQKSFIFFYKNLSNNPINTSDSKLLESIEICFNHLINMFSNKNPKINLSKVINEIANLKKSISLKNRCSQLGILNKEIVIWLEAFGLSLNYLFDTSENFTVA